jgi:hypothetical protein
MTRRVSLPAATKAVLQYISKEPATIEEISSSLRINRRTVGKVLGLITEIQRFEEKGAVEIVSVNPRRRLVRRIARSENLSSLPTTLQKFLIRTVFPHQSREDEILCRLRLAGALNPTLGISLSGDKPLRRLIKQGQVASTRGRRVYLTEEGRVVADGALRLFPELLSNFSEPGESSPLGLPHRLQSPSPKASAVAFRALLSKSVGNRIIYLPMGSLSGPISSRVPLGQVGLASVASQVR